MMTSTSPWIQPQTNQLKQRNKNKHIQKNEEIVEEEVFIGRIELQTKINEETESEEYFSCNEESDQELLEIRGKKNKKRRRRHCNSQNMLKLY